MSIKLGSQKQTATKLRCPEKYQKYLQEKTICIDNFVKGSRQR